MSSSAPHSKTFAIIGHPIGHSLSPALYDLAFHSCALPFVYERLDVPPEDLADTIAKLRATSSGFNITIPHKSAIIPHLDSLSSSAQFIGAVNTVLPINGKLHGENTDIDGIIASLRPFREELRDQDALLLGAGGSARAVLFALTREFRMRSISIISRRMEQSKAIAEDFNGTETRVAAGELEPLVIQSVMDHAILVVNSTPAGMHPHRDESPLPDDVHFRSGQIAFDLVYRPIQTRFLRSAHRSSCRTISGLEMLVQQGASAFRLFTGFDMPVDLVRDHLRNILEAERSTNR